jgi:hypothetical protein
VPGGHGEALARGADLGQPPLDPRAQLGDGQGRLALAGARAGSVTCTPSCASTATRTRRARVERRIV